MSSERRDLLGTLVSKAIQLGADELEIEYKDGQEMVFACKAGLGFGIAAFRSSGKEAASLLEQVRTIGKKGKNIEVFGAKYRLKVTAFDSFGETAYRVAIREA